MTLVPRLPIRVLAAAALAVAAVALSPGGAAASCGDYVRIGAEQATSHHPPAIPKVPCHGPGCSKAPAPLVPLTAPVQTRSDSEQLPALVATAAAAYSGRGWSHSTAAHPQPIRLTSAIFHPPRAG